MPGDACISHFTKGFDIYMRSMIQEAEDRETKHVRTVNDYLQLRRETFGAQATMSFLSFGLGLPEQVLSHPVMQTVTLTAMNLLCIINVSFNTEERRNVTTQTYRYFFRTCIPTLLSSLEESHSTTSSRRSFTSTR